LDACVKAIQNVEINTQEIPRKAREGEHFPRDEESRMNLKNGNSHGRR